MKIAKITIFLPFLLLPSYLIRIPISPSASINLLDILLILGLFSAIFIFFQKHLWVDFGRFLAQKLFAKTFLTGIFVAGAIFSYLISLNPDNWQDGLGILKSFLFLPIIFAFLTAFLAHKKIIKFPWIVLAYFSSIFALSLLGIGWSIAGKMTFDSRLALFFDSPNHFAMLLAPALLAGWWILDNIQTRFFGNKNLFISTAHPSLPVFKKIIWIGLVLIAINLLLTQSLGAWVGLATGGVFFFAIINQKSRFLKFLKIGILATSVAGLILILHASFLASFFDYNPSTPATPLDSRIAIYQASEKILKDRPIVGIGPGNFQSTYLAHQAHFPPYPQWAVPHAHNNLIQTWIELGFFAFLPLFLLLVIRFFQKQKRPECVLAVSIIACLFTHGIIDNTIWHNDMAVLFWFLFLF